MIPCTRLLPYVSVKSSSYLLVSVCVVTAHRCVFVCKWFVSDVFVMQRLLCTLSRCVGALHFFGWRCLLSNAGSAAVIIHAGVGWCDPFCSRLCTPTPTQDTNYSWCPGVPAQPTFSSFISSSGRTLVRLPSFRPWLPTAHSFCQPVSINHGRTDHGQVQVASILSSNTMTCYNTKLTLNCLVL